MNEVEKPSQDRINLALTRAILEIWSAVASQVSMNADIVTYIVAREKDTDVQEALVNQLRDGKDTLTSALTLLKKLSEELGVPPSQVGDDDQH